MVTLPADPTQPPLTPLLSTMLIGWGSVLMSSVPDRAVVEAGEAALLAASAPAMASFESKDVVNALHWVRATASTAWSVTSQGLAQVATFSPGDALAVEKILQLNPPLGVAFAIAVLRAVPTCLVIVMAELTTLFNLVVFGHGSASHLSLPLVMLPFALSELVSVATAVGLRRGVRAVLYSRSAQETDGMSVLRWSSPKLAAAWLQFKAADARLGAVSGSLLRVLWAPREILFPSEEAIANAPEFSGELARKLGMAALIDTLGVATFSVPVLGEIVDVVWAPVSAYLIQRTFGMVGFTVVGFIEELLPFTDIIPTALIAFVWCNGANIPIWLIRAKREAQSRAVQRMKTE